MTNCELEVSVRSAVWPVRLNAVVAGIIQANIEEIGMPAWTDEEQALAKTLQAKAGKPVTGLVEKVTKGQHVTKPIPASNDCGDVSWKVPMGRVLFPSNVPSLGFHHWSAGSALATSIAHKGAMVGTKALGMSVLDYFLDAGDLMVRTKQSFREEIGDTKYHTLLPEDQKPPLDLNRHEMEKFRNLMEPHYLKVRPTIVA
jgi:aminobenzoyl-glutamate utilization protein B